MGSALPAVRVSLYDTEETLLVISVVFVFLHNLQGRWRWSLMGALSADQNISFQAMKPLQQLYVINDSGDRVPLAAFARFTGGNAPLSVAHQEQSAISTIALNLNDVVSL